MRRLPVYFLIDVSESMAGTPVQQVEQGLRTIIQNLRSDPYAIETAFVAVIGFAGKPKVLSPLTELYRFYPPTFPLGGGTSLGAALDLLMDDIEANVQKTTPDTKGDWKPIVFLFTDGTPTDQYQGAFSRWNQKYRRRCNLVAVSIGDNVNTGLLGQLTENVLQLTKTSPESFAKFFKWITASISTSSQAVSDCGREEMALPSLSGIDLEKVDPARDVAVDENFVVLRARCSTTRNEYLVKYARRSEDVGVEGFSSSTYRLVGAYPIDADAYREMSLDTPASSNPRINSMELRGMPTCPCCGNQLGVVMCDCGGLFCVDPGQQTIQCPWCGMEGGLGDAGPGGMDIMRGRG